MTTNIKKFTDTEVYRRAISDTPPFFRKLRMYAWITALVIPAVTGSIMTAGIMLPVWIVVITGAITSMATAVAGSTYLPTVDKTLQDESAQKNARFAAKANKQ